jgi:hypothetical protein
VNGSAPSIGAPGAPDPDWVAAYEDLRRAALEADGWARRGPGIAVVLRAGVVAWMQACRSVAGVGATCSRGGDTTGWVPGPVRAEVSLVLAQMALSAAAETTP